MDTDRLCPVRDEAQMKLALAVELGMEEQLPYDIYYSENQDVFSDFKIFMVLVKRVINQKRL